MMSPEEKARRRQEWNEHTDKRKVLIEKLCAHSNSHVCYIAPDGHQAINECEEYNSLLDQLRDTDPKECEHGRSWATNCMACDEIHKEVFPENYGECRKCSELVR